MNSVQRLSANWNCPICGRTIDWSYYQLANRGVPVCPDDDTDMELDINSGELNLTNQKKHGDSG